MTNNEVYENKIINRRITVTGQEDGKVMIKAENIQAPDCKTTYWVSLSEKSFRSIIKDGMWDKVI